MGKDRLQTPPVPASVQQAQKKNPLLMKVCAPSCCHRYSLYTCPLFPISTVSTLIHVGQSDVGRARAPISGEQIVGKVHGKANIKAEGAKDGVCFDACLHACNAFACSVNCFV